MKDKKHTHYMSIYSKIWTSIKKFMNSSDKSLDDTPSVVTKAFPYISLVVPRNFYEF